MFAAGVLHGLGPDHLAAITALAGADSGFQRIISCALRFALGHAMVIALAGGAALLGKELIPAAWEIAFDVLAGTLLVVAGVVVFVAFATGYITLEHRVHIHGKSSHRHSHLQLRFWSEHRDIHDLKSITIGALFGLGGSRSVLAIAPLALSHSVGDCCLRIIAFTLGIGLAMTAFGAVASRILRFRFITPQSMALLSAILCIVTGCWTIAGRLL
jgi:hypothetical protein